MSDLLCNEMTLNITKNFSPLGFRGIHSSAQMDNTAPHPRDFCVVKAGSVLVIPPASSSSQAAGRLRLTAPVNLTCKAALPPFCFAPCAGLPLTIPVHMPVIWHREDCGRTCLQTRGTAEQQGNINAQYSFSSNVTTSIRKRQITG